MVQPDALDGTVSKRHEFLAILIEEPLSKPALVERLDTSRSTVDRAISELEDLGLVRATDSEYRTTQSGKCAYRAYQTYLSRIRGVRRASEVLDDLPPDADLDPEILVDADVHVSEPLAPQQPVQTVVDILTDARQVRGVGPIVLPEHVDTIRDAVSERELQIDLVLTPWTQDRLGDQYRREYGSLSESENVRLHESDESVPYGLWIAECGETTTSGLVVYSDSGVRGTIVNDTTAMNRWARDKYESVRGTVRGEATI